LASKGKGWVEQKIIGPLNTYLHPYFPSFEISKDWCPGCPAAVKFNREEFEKWLEMFQRIV